MKAILFDLDNTLYDVTKYNARAFKHVSNYISKKYNLDNLTVLQQLTTLWSEKTSMYSHLFDDLLNVLNIKNENIQNLVTIFNAQDTQITDFFTDAIPSIIQLKNYFTLGLVTDGNISRQKRKIQASKLENMFNVMIFTKNFEPKPSPVGFQKAIERINVSPNDSVYVGDNPLLDFKGPKTIGMKTIRIIRGEFKDIPSNSYIDMTVNNLDELCSSLIN